VSGTYFSVKMFQQLHYFVPLIQFYCFQEFVFSFCNSMKIMSYLLKDLYAQVGFTEAIGDMKPIGHHN